MSAGRVCGRAAGTRQPDQTDEFESTIARFVVHVISDDPVWALLLSTNLKARGYSAQIGNFEWFKTTTTDFNERVGLIVDFGTYQLLLKDHYASVIERIKSTRSQTVAVVNSGWTRRARARLPVAAVLKRREDMRHLMRHILDNFLPVTGPGVKAAQLSSR